MYVTRIGPVPDGVTAVSDEKDGFLRTVPPGLKPDVLLPGLGHGLGFGV